MNDDQQLRDFLEKIQLVQFLEDIVKILHVTRVDHFEHVIDVDLQSIGMSMPEIRRLFDNAKKNKKKPFLTKLKKSLRSSNSSIETIHTTSNNTTTKYNEHSKEPKQQEVKCLIQEKDISFQDILGKGAFGYVRSAEWTTNSHEKILVAVKCIRSTGGNGVKDVQNEVVKEANAMSCLNHPNLIRLYGVMISSPMMLVTELAPLGTLLRKLRQEPHRFPISTLSSFLVQIAAGMKYLEKNKLVHRDIAARNILLMSYEKIKIGDFGLARPLDNADHYIMHPEGLIPFAWCAPECLKYKKFSHASDVWAFGITAYEFFTHGAEPWAGLNGAQILDKIDEPNCERPCCPEMCPREIYTILCSNCWNYEENERSNFEVLEKKLLEALPREVKAVNMCSNISSRDRLSFSHGDIITVFNINSVDGIWKGQNRTTGQVGFFPSTYVDFSTQSITAELDIFDGVKSSHEIETENRLTVPTEGFSNKLCGNLWTSNKDNDIVNSTSSIGHSSLPCNLAPTKVQDLKGDCQCNSFSSSGYGTSSDKGSYCDDCLSQNSIGSVCICRCSTYSSDSSQKSQRYKEDFGIPTSQPISIPGANNDRVQNKRNSASFPRRCSSSGSQHTYSVISDTPTSKSSTHQRCSFCNSSQFYSLKSESQCRCSSNEFSQSTSPVAHSRIPGGIGSSPVAHSDSPSGIGRLKKTLSGLKLDLKNISTSKEESKQSHSMGERRTSLPDLMNPRKNDLLRRTRRSLRMKKRTMSTNDSKSSTQKGVGVDPGTKFYVQTKESLISSPVLVTDDSKFSFSLYDLVPTRSEQEQLSHDRNEIAKEDTIISPTTPPISTSTPKQVVYEVPKPIEPEIYENVSFIRLSPVAPPRRKKQESKRLSMIEFGSDDPLENSPKTKQCVILNQTDNHYGNMNF